MDREPELLGDEPVRLPRLGRSGDLAEPEVLDASPGQLWRLPRWLSIAVVLAVLLGAGGWYADRHAREHESASLAGCLRALHNAVIFSDLQMMAAATRIRPVLASADGPARAAAVARMSQPARQVLPEVTRARQVCRAVSVRAWHFSLTARRDAATIYAEALAGRLRQIAADGATYYRDDSPLRRLRRAADLGVFGGRY